MLAKNWKAKNEKVKNLCKLTSISFSQYQVEAPIRNMLFETEETVEQCFHTCLCEALVVTTFIIHAVQITITTKNTFLTPMQAKKRMWQFFQKLFFKPLCILSLLPTEFDNHPIKYVSKKGCSLTSSSWLSFIVQFYFLPLPSLPYNVTFE